MRARYRLRRPQAGHAFGETNPIPKIDGVGAGVEARAEGVPTTSFDALGCREMANGGAASPVAGNPVCLAR